MSDFSSFISQLLRFPLLCSFLFSSFCVCVIFLPAYAAPVKELRQYSVAAELKLLRAKIDREQKRTDALLRRKKEIQAALLRVTAEIEGVTRQKKEMLSSLKDVDALLLELKAGIIEVKKRIVKKKKAIDARVVGIYKMSRRVSIMDYLFKAASVAEFLKRAHFIGSIISKDRANLLELENYIEQLRTRTKKLRDYGLKKRKLLEDLAVHGRELEGKKMEKATLLFEARNKQKILAESLARLKRSAAYLERILAGVMGAKASKNAGVKNANPLGRGLKHLRGRLPLPVRGRVIRRFGKVHHEEFSDILFVKGLEYRTDLGEKVRAVAPGRVVFAKILPGYGNVVIVDHGLRYYSLYGRLASSIVREGELVKLGDVLAVLGDVDGKGRNFYFELRLKGKAIDPMGFFARKPDFLADLENGR